jgi:CHAT domain-containing protein
MDAIKILFLAANPEDHSRLNLDQEIRGITEKIRAAAHRDHLNLISVWAVQPDDLLQALNEHRPHIVHFSGHGYGHHGIILLERDGSSKLVNAVALAALFKTLKDNLRVVILNACYSSVQATAISGIVDFTIGMKDSISDEAAATFAASFYRAIGFGRSIQEAFDQAKAALLLAGIPEDDIPVLLTRPGADAATAILVNPR